MIIIPYINPVRFHTYNETQPDFPTFDDMVAGVQYQRGVYPVDGFRQDWLLGETLSILVYDTGTSSTSVVLVANSVSYFGTFITTLATGENVYIYNIPFNTEGEYVIDVFEFNGVGYTLKSQSDTILVREQNQDLHEIRYSDSRNRYEGYWFIADGTQVWNPKTYFTSIKTDGEPKNEYSIYTDDPEIPRKLKAAPVNTTDLVIADISFLHAKRLNSLLSSDVIYLDNEKVVNVENYSKEDVDNSDIRNYIVNFSFVENTYSLKIS